MTTTTKTRTRKARTVTKDIVPRGQHLIDVPVDVVILSSRMAVTPEPVFWADGELDARTTLAVHADAGWEDNYERADVGGGYHWDWYRAAALADALEAVSVVAVTVARDALPVIMPGTPMPQDTGLDAKVTAIIDRLNAAHDEEDGIPKTSPGPVAPSRNAAQPPAGPGDPQDDDPALD